MEHNRSRIDSLADWARNNYGCSISLRVARKYLNDDAHFWAALSDVKASNQPREESCSGQAGGEETESRHQGRAVRVGDVTGMGANPKEIGGLTPVLKRLAKIRTGETECGTQSPAKVSTMAEKSCSLVLFRHTPRYTCIQPFALEGLEDRIHLLRDSLRGGS